MALEDQKAVYEVQITRTGDGAAQSIQDFQNLDNAARSASSTLSASSESLTKLRESSLLAREGMVGLTDATLLAGGTRFPQLQEGVMEARSGLMLLRTATMLTGASIGTVSLALAGVAAVVAVGVTAWSAYEARLQAIAAAQDLQTQSAKLYLDVAKKIQDYERLGIMTQEQALQIEEAEEKRPASRGWNHPDECAEVGSRSGADCKPDGFLGGFG